ncbi:MAG: HD domain-containing protein [Planctomycetes bacterium]|nr:HD domain-containing protein [Planctomycetota bacterium]
MTAIATRDKKTFETMLIIITLGMMFLLWKMGEHRIVVLNLFFLPIVLSGYFLGRTNAGVLALLSVLAVTIVTTMDPVGLANFKEPIMVGLALTVWGGALGLTAILVGTLCDQRSKTVHDLHEAYVGVVEVLSRYLQSANPKSKARSIRIAEMSRKVAEEMRLTQKEVDDVRVGALLHDLGNVEITTQLLTKAMDTLESEQTGNRSYTFSGRELVQSLGTVLRGAVPLLLTQDEALNEQAGIGTENARANEPKGAKIIRAVRVFDSLSFEGLGEERRGAEDTVRELRKEVSGGYDPDVLDAIERVAQQSARSGSRKPALV